MEIDPKFRRTIEYLDLVSIENSRDVIFIVDRQFRLQAFNQAWVDFAVENDGRSVLDQFPLGASILKALPAKLKSFLIAKFNQAVLQNKPFEHDYECSSARQYRVFHQSAYPLVNAAGLVISNHLIKFSSHTETTRGLLEGLIDEDGIIVQCCNCRKVRDPDNQQLWLWVPEAIEKKFSRISHAICPRCYDFYYPEIEA